jgi:hypothetical protein
MLISFINYIEHIRKNYDMVNLEKDIVFKTDEIRKIDFEEFEEGKFITCFYLKTGEFYSTKNHWFMKSNLS